MSPPPVAPAPRKPLMLRCLCGHRAALGRPMDLLDMRKVDAGLGASLERLAAAHRTWMGAGRPHAPLLVDGSPIEDLCLSFVLPGAFPLPPPPRYDAL